MKTGLKQENDTGAVTVVLPSVVDIAACGSIQHRLHDILGASPQKIVVDASNVERISTAGIQLFLSLQKSAQRANSSVVLAKESGPTALAFDDLGLGIYYASLIKGE